MNKIEIFNLAVSFYPPPSGSVYAQPTSSGDLCVIEFNGYDDMLDEKWFDNLCLFINVDVYSLIFENLDYNVFRKNDNS